MNNSYEDISDAQKEKNKKDIIKPMNIISVLKKN